MSTHKMFSWRNKKITGTFRLKKVPYMELYVLYYVRKNVSGLCFGICMIPIICQGYNQVYYVL